MKEKTTYIIAEAGVNHNGEILVAKKMIDVAKECGVDAIKFQTFKSNNVVSKYAPKAQYQINNTGNEESQLNMIKRLEFSELDFIELKRYCDNSEIKFMSTPFDFQSIDFLYKLGMDIFKIPSGEINNLPYLRKIGRLRMKVILSTGMSYMSEIEDAIKILNENGTNDISILHCTTEYPTPFDEVNLNVLRTFKDKFNCEIGYSDHTRGIAIPVAAVALGATIIEKHFTMDKNMDGPDHMASIEPSELMDMVKAIRNVELSMGSYEKKPTESEFKNINVARKSIVASRCIRKGEVLCEENITTKRPGFGISPMQWDRIIGTYAIRDFFEDEMIEI